MPIHRVDIYSVNFLTQFFFILRPNQYTFPVFSRLIVSIYHTPVPDFAATSKNNALRTLTRGCRWLAFREFEYAVSRFVSCGNDYTGWSMSDSYLRVCNHRTWKELLCVPTMSVVFLVEPVFFSFPLFSTFFLRNRFSHRSNNPARSKIKFSTLRFLPSVKIKISSFKRTPIR